VLRFCDGGAETIWSTKSLNEFDVMNKEVLPWKIETLETNTACPKNLMMVVKPLKGII
jgi:hypothetical protein